MFNRKLALALLVVAISLLVAAYLFSPVFQSGGTAQASSQRPGLVMEHLRSGQAIVLNAPASKKDCRVIPVVINILKSTDITEEKAKEAVKKASQILKKLMCVTLKVEKVNELTDNDGDDGSDSGTAGDSKLTNGEIRKVLTSGLKEIAKLGKRGLKITFVNTPSVAHPSSPGASAHKIPVILVEPRDTTDLTGSTIAHELGHILTLKLHPKKDPDADATEKKDENLMTPSNGGRDKVVKDGTKGIGKLELTPRQKKKIIDDGVLDKIGKKIVRVDSVLIKEQFGAVADDLGDQVASDQPYNDLNWIAMISEEGLESINTLLALGGLFPDDGAVDTTYRLLFNADANLETGIAVNDFLGIDREVSLQVSRNEETGELSVSGLIFDYATDFVFGFPTPPLLEVGNLLFDLDLPPEPFQHQLVFDIPKNTLTLTADLVPVDIIAEDNVTGTVQDVASLVFNRDLSAIDIILSQHEVNSGDLVSFTASGLPIFGTYTVLVDDILVLSGTSDGQGEVFGFFVFPSTPSGDYFISIEDSTGDFAFDVLIRTNSAPVAVDDSAVVAAGQAVTVQVLDNDTDPDGDPLVVVDASPAAFGTVAFGPTNLIYTADAGFSGTDQFIYTISDSEGALSSATVLIDVIIVIDDVQSDLDPVIQTDNLVRLWHFDNFTKAWTFFDPLPGFASANTVNQLLPNQVYWMLVNRTQTVTLSGNQYTLFAGWNLVIWLG